MRRKRYFCNHTLLDGHNFDYLADPVAILKGRGVAFDLLLVAALAVYVQPWLAPVLLALFFIVLPWLLVRSRQFNARNSSHRGLRFDFKGDLGEATRIFLGWNVLMLLSLGTLLPYLLFRKTAYIAGNHAYGATGASFRGRGRAYYRVFMNAGLLLFAPLVVIVAAGIIFATIQHEGPVGLAELIGILSLGLLLLYAAIPVAAGYVKARVARLTFIGTRFGGLRFAGRHTARGLIGLYAANLALIALTLGLYIPWARVRSAHYWLDNLALVGPAQGLDAVVAAAGVKVASVGEERREVFDDDLGVA